MAIDEQLLIEVSENANTALEKVGEALKELPALRRLISDEIHRINESLATNSKDTSGMADQLFELGDRVSGLEKTKKEMSNRLCAIEAGQLAAKADKQTPDKCPFCGSHTTEVQVHDIEYGDRHHVFCYNCESFGPSCHEAKSAVALWNGAKRG